jgi:hypothetical protein
LVNNSQSIEFVTLNISDQIYNKCNESHEGVTIMVVSKRFFLLMFVCLMVFVPAVGAQGVISRDDQGSSLASDSRLSPWNISSIMGYPHGRALDSVYFYTSDPTDPTLCSPYKNSSWLSFVSPYTGKMTVDTSDSEFDTVLAAFQQSPILGNLLACNDDYVGTRSQITFNVMTGYTYYIMAGAWSGASISTLNDGLIVDFLMNDYYKNGYVIPGSSTNYVRVQVGTRWADTVGDLPFNCLAAPYNFNHGVWHKFKPTSSGYYTFTTNGSNYDTVLGVYRSATPPTPVGCDDDGGAGSASRVRVYLTANRVYYIQIARYGTVASTTDMTTRLTMRRS